FTLGGGGFQLFLLLRPLRLNFISFPSDGLLDFLQSGLRNVNAALGFFGGHHHFKLAIIGLGHFGLGVGDFMLQCFVGFVGFHGAALIAVFAGAVFPLLPVELELLAFRHDMGVGLFRGGDVGTGAAEFAFCFAAAFWKSFQCRAQNGDLV